MIRHLINAEISGEKIARANLPVSKKCRNFTTLKENGYYITTQGKRLICSDIAGHIFIPTSTLSGGCIYVDFRLTPRGRQPFSFSSVYGNRFSVACKSLIAKRK